MSPRRAPSPRVQRTRVLFVCTANRCRSPLAEAIARHDAGALPIEFASAGLLESGQPVPDTGVRVAREFGVDLSRHRSTQIDLDAMLEFDVVLTMTREHSRELVAARPELWPNVFTVKQFERWLVASPPMSSLPSGQRLRDRLPMTAADRSRVDLLGFSPADDTRDPFGQSARIWRSVATELRDSIDGILDSLAPAESPLSSSSR